MSNNAQSEILLQVNNLSVEFITKSGLWGRNKHVLKAVDNFSFSIKKGQTVGLVGESGSGKTTAALAIARLIDTNQGVVKMNSMDLLKIHGEELRQARTKLQFIFQDPYSSLNPRKRAEEIVREPLDSLTDLDLKTRNDVVKKLFRSVGLREEQQKLFPHQFSGGQRQRLGIARALATNPELIICDEAVSALDVAVQAQILNLLKDLQRDHSLTYLFISHDLGVVKYMCDTVVVMYMGRIVEHAESAQIFSRPRHPYTKALLDAVPKLHMSNDTRSIEELHSPEMTQGMSDQGCKFASRCPIALSKCKNIAPELVELNDNHEVACHAFDNVQH